MDVKYCKCGCNTALKKKKSIWAKNHNRRKSWIEYIEEDCGYKTPCWIWQRGINGAGYGCTYETGKYCPAHKYFYEKYVQFVPEGLSLDHLCRKRSCVNPFHLEIVTTRENNRRGRATKLNKDQVLEIRKRYKEENALCKELAEIYEVTVSNIECIVKNKSWKVID